MSRPIKICQVASGSSMTELLGMLEPYGDYEISYECSEDTDFILGWSVSVMDKTEHLINQYPHAQFVAYNWDVYEWVWSRPRPGEYNYNKYGQLLKKAVEVWCPSQCTVDRMKQWYGVDGKVIFSSVPYYDVPVSDGRYVLNALRTLPDNQEGWVARACDELGIPCVRPEHNLPLDEFQKVVADCTLIVNGHYEGSTGGLSLMEAYYLGKPGLICASPWMGGNEYMKDRVHTFDGYEDLKSKIKEMFDNPPRVAPDHKEFIVENFSRLAMGKQIHDRLQALYVPR